MAGSLLETLLFDILKTLAQHFTRIASSIEEDLRPTTWAEVIVLLIRKGLCPKLIHDFRPVALMSQFHKLWSKWLTIQAGQIFSEFLIPTQNRFHRHYQALESNHLIHRTLEVRDERDQQVILTKVDVTEAFDSIYHSSAMAILSLSRLHPQIACPLARELRFSQLQLHLFGATPSNLVATHCGVKQGSPDSAVLFVATLGEQLQQLELSPARLGICDGTRTCQ